MSDLTKHLSLFEKIVDGDAYLKFRTGASNDEVSKINSILNPHFLSEELEALYKWRNGCEDESFDAIPAFGFRLLPLDEAIGVLNEYRSDTIHEDKRYFPIGDMDGALILALINSNKLIESEVCVFLYEEDSVYLWHESIGKLLQTSIDICSAKDSEGKTYDDIRLRYSPNAEPDFW